MYSIETSPGEPNLMPAQRSIDARHNTARSAARTRPGPAWHTLGGLLVTGCGAFHGLPSGTQAGSPASLTDASTFVIDARVTNSGEAGTGHLETPNPSIGPDAGCMMGDGSPPRCTCSQPPILYEFTRESIESNLARLRAAGGDDAGVVASSDGAFRCPSVEQALAFIGDATALPYCESQPRALLDAAGNVLRCSYLIVTFPYVR
jgi:hypothetical protein